jgi:hypothetical protein
MPTKRTAEMPTVKATYRRLTFDRIGTTEDTGHPVVHAELPDTGSWMNIIVDGTDDMIRVTHVESAQRGDMKVLLDEIVDQLDETHVRFMTPLGDALERRLHGFETIYESVSASTPVDDDEVEALDGHWHLNSDEMEENG